MKYGLKEDTIQKICAVFARYLQVKKRFYTVSAPRELTGTVRI